MTKFHERASMWPTESMPDLGKSEEADTRNLIVLAGGRSGSIPCCERG